MNLRESIWADLSPMFIKYQNMKGVRMSLQTKVVDYIVNLLNKK